MKSCSSNFTAFYYFDLFYQRRVDRESLFHAYSGSDSSYSESLADSAVLSLQNKAFKNLNSFSVSFFDFNVYLYGVSNVKRRDISLELILYN